MFLLSFPFLFFLINFQQRQLAHAAASAPNDDALNACLEQMSLNELPCTDPNCRENFQSNINNNETSHTSHSQQSQEQQLHFQHLADLDNGPNGPNDPSQLDNAANLVSEDDRKESIDSQEFLLGENMTASPSDQERVQLDNSCADNCQQYNSAGQHCNADCQQCNKDGTASCSAGQGENHTTNEFYDPLMNHNVYCSDGKWSLFLSLSLSLLPF